MTQAHTRIVRPQDLQSAAPPGAAFPVPSTPPPPGPHAVPAFPLPPGADAAGSPVSPQSAAAAAGAAMATAQTPFPSEAPGIYDNLVRLPGGLSTGNEYIWTAEIRELTGADEEKMARAGQSANPYHFLETLLACGTVRLGDKSPAETASLLPRLLTGDRDMIGLAIRIATYGPEYEVREYICPMCGGMTARVTCSLLTQPEGDIELRTLARPEDAYFEVELRHGGRAFVRLPSGSDQKYLADFLKVTAVELNSAMLRRCMIKIEEPSGYIRDVAAEPSVVLSMGAADRKAVLKEIAGRQPGPQLLQGVRFNHIDCGKEVTLPVTMGALFLG